MKQKLRVLHLASFDGNVGDNANHSGAMLLWRKYVTDYEFVITRLEMRDFFWKERQFDLSFASYANEFDLLIIGGGNYFEFWVESSPTGTSVAIPKQVLSSIKCPIFFNSLGVDRYNGYSDLTVNNFKKFLDKILASTNYFVSVRNDGSSMTLREIFGESYQQSVHVIPDGGFFIELNENDVAPLLKDATNNKLLLGVNIAGDMLDKRFTDPQNAELVLQNFVTGLSHFIDTFDFEVVFFPHIYDDLNVIHRALSFFKDKHRRKSVSVAPYLHGQGSERLIFGMYRHVSLMFSNRFHANVCSMAVGTPVIGLFNYPQISELYRELEMTDYLLDFSKNFSTLRMIDKASAMISDSDFVKRRYNTLCEALEASASHELSELNKWLNKHFI